MTHPFRNGMAKATALIRAGNLTEATVRIQAMLRGAPDTPEPDPDMIEGTFTAVDPAAHRADPARRKPLGETLRTLARGKMPGTGGRKTDPANQDPRFTTHTCSGPEGSRDYMLYVPSGAAASTMPVPVIVMLHGCTQSPLDFAAGTGMNRLAEAQGFIVVYPAQPTAANMNKCWNWFRPGDQARGAGEPAVLAAITRAVLATQNADPARVYVAGLSAGGAAAMVLAREYRDVFAAVGVHSGLAAGAARDVAQAFAAMQGGAAGEMGKPGVPAIVFHGTADPTVAVANAGAVARQAQAGLTGQRGVRRGTAAGGRGYEVALLTAADGRTLSEVWLIDGAGHAWAGGSMAGSYADPAGPDASAEMVRFFAQHRVITPA